MFFKHFTIHILKIVKKHEKNTGLRSRTFSLKINKLPTFSEINQGWLRGERIDGK